MISQGLVVHNTLYERIYLVVARIPPGYVTTYGHIAAMVGECTPRVVGYAMAAIPPGAGLPWHRVINGHGRLSVRRDGRVDWCQRRRLEAEGVAFDVAGCIDLAVYGWPGPSVAWLARRNMHVAVPPWLCK